MKMIKSLWIFCCSIICLNAAAQKTSDKTSMEEERRQIQEELSLIQKSYNAVKGQASENLSQLASLNRKLELQEKYINNISKEIGLIDDDIYYSQIEVNRLRKQLDTLKVHYARSVVYAYKNRSNYDYLNFIFSANNFNDALKRMAYLRSYRTYRQQQVTDINNTQYLIAKRREQQESSRGQKKNAISSREGELNALALQKREKDSVVSILKSDMSGLQKQIANKKKRDSELKSSIASVVRKEIAEAKKLAQEEAKKQAAQEAMARERAALQNKGIAIVSTPGNKNVGSANVPGKAAPLKNVPVVKNTDAQPENSNAGSTPATTVPATKQPEVVRDVAKAEVPKPVNKAPEGGYLNFTSSDVALNSNFALNKGKLPYPLDNGIVTLGFGRYKIEGIGPDVVGDNPGVTFAAPVGAAVKAVFEGEVAAVSSIGGMYLVIIRHGKYFTAYSNLAAAAVSKGSSVSRGQTIGKVGADEETGNGKLDFILMIEDRNINPMGWLRK